MRTSMVYIMTNHDVMNKVIAFRREINGILTFMDSYPTNGKGTGTREVSTQTPNDGIDPLASQGSLALSRDGRFLFAVNTGSDSISSFIIKDTGELVLADVRPSGGAQPNGLDVYDDLLYVSNVGNTANNFTSNITGFHIHDTGHLTHIPGSTHSLSTMNAQPSRVGFTPDGSKIVISELKTNRLSVFHVNNDGTVTGPIMNDSHGMGPFGSCFLSSGLLLVTEAESNALSSYSVSENGILHVISGSVPTGQRATCWVAATKNECFAYATNTGSGTITAYRIDSNGALTVIGRIRSTPAGTPTGLPMDVGMSKDGRNFYTFNGNQGTVSVFSISQENGVLDRLQVAEWTKTRYFWGQGLAVL
ncbi:lactonase family protein [Alicyclobacillus fastidiosus]|uniref:Beta-propeller fold lactonase family protein n=1 Tax=Alicyclobacillus fastidiosus TaxID=392011 RepID=A0ABV5ACE6_9BACL|nr:beta-propeller fold lactonase family protein [Alicyclobacillus fastidiosus]WEH11362.1 beta-propeller fold lactonase family protein [Alicyclobacillus fastidiosus]